MLDEKRLREIAIQAIRQDMPGVQVLYPLRTLKLRLLLTECWNDDILKLRRNLVDELHTYTKELVEKKLITKQESEDFINQISDEVVEYYEKANIA